MTMTIIMTGYGTVETAIAAMKVGAFDYILKPFKPEEVLKLSVDPAGLYCFTPEGERI